MPASFNWCTLQKKKGIHSKHTQKPAFVYITKGNTEFMSTMPKRLDWDLFSVSKERVWTVLHPNRLNGFPSQQKTRLCYIKKQKTEPFPIATEISALQPNRNARKDNTLQLRPCTCKYIPQRLCNCCDTGMPTVNAHACELSTAHRLRLVKTIICVRPSICRLSLTLH